MCAFIFWLRHLAPQYFTIRIKVFFNLCSRSHIGLLEEPECFEDASWSCLWSFCVQLKMETRQMGIYFWITHAKMIQNIQWGKGARWPRLQLSFTKFVSVKWTWLRGRPDYVTGLEPFINETHDPRDSGSLAPTSHFMCVCVWEKDSLWQYYREPLWYLAIWDNASLLNNIAALLHCNNKEAGL